MTIFEQAVDYNNLEKAFLDVTGSADEELVINLQNHLIWGSYKPEGTLVDLVVEKAFLRVLFLYSQESQNRSSDAIRLICLEKHPNYRMMVQ